MITASYTIHYSPLIRATHVQLDLCTVRYFITLVNFKHFVVETDSSLISDRTQSQRHCVQYKVHSALGSDSYTLLYVALACRSLSQVENELRHFTLIFFGEGNKKKKRNQTKTNQNRSEISKRFIYDFVRFFDLWLLLLLS